MTSTGPIEREVTSFCRLCPALCGIKVRLSGDEVVEVRGDPDHPFSRGYTCPKGRATPQFHHSPNRLDRPVVQGLAVDWDTCLDDLAGRVRRLVDDYGPDAVGFYSGMGEAYDRAGIMAKFRLFGALGTRERYTAASVDTAPAWRAAELVTGYAMDLMPHWDPENSARTVVLIGANTLVSHGASVTDPIVRIRQFRKNGGELWVLDPRRTETAALADHHLAPRPGTDAFVLAWLVREILEDGADAEELDRYTWPDDLMALRAALAPFDLGVAVARTGLDPEQLKALLASIRRSGHVVCIDGTGVRFSPNSLVTVWLMWALHIVTGSLDRPDGVSFPSGFLAPRHERTDWQPSPDGGAWLAGPPSRPELPAWYGEYPVVALPDEIEAGRLRALFVLGANPLTAWPDPNRTVRTLRSLDVLAVFDVLHNALTEMATHALPVADIFERPDVSGRDSNMFAPAVVPIGADRKPQWWILAQLARRLDLDVLGGLDPDTCTPEEVLAQANGAPPERMAELIAAGPHGIPFKRPTGWVRGMLPGGRWRLAPKQMLERLPDLLADQLVPEFVLTSRRQLRSVNSVRYTKPADATREPPDIVIHPGDAARVGAIAGAPLRLHTSSGQLDVIARLDPSILRGTVSLPEGAMETNVNNLMSPTEGVDPLSGMPLLSGVAVRIEVLEDRAGPGGDLVSEAVTEYDAVR